MKLHIKNYIWVALALISTSCGGALAGGTINVDQPQLAPPHHPVGLTVRDVAGPVVGAMCGLDGATDAAVGPSNANGTIIFPSVPLSLRATQLVCTEPGYQPFSEHRDLTGEDPEPALVAMLSPVPPPVQPLDKRDFIEHYQGNFGSIAADPCYTVSRTLFDPVALLVTWTNDRPCFERLMQQHADRGDNRVVIDPRASYHESVAPIDLWHDPPTFRLFIEDIRRHMNNRGEHFKVLPFFSADGHIDTFLKDGEGDPDPAAEAHFARTCTRSPRPRATSSTARSPAGNAGTSATTSRQAPTSGSASSSPRSSRAPGTGST
jgi:hypothetical protein